MNLAITTTSARTWKALKTHYIVAIAGAALALASLAGAASLSIDWGGSDNPIARSASSAVVAADQKYVTFYLVGSEAERERVIAIEGGAAVERDSADLESNASFAVFVARTPDEVMAAELAIYEAMGTFSEAYAAVNLVDLINR